MQAFFGLVLSTPSLDFGPRVTSNRRAARLDDLVDDIDTDPYMTEILRPSGDEPLRAAGGTLLQPAAGV
jgi:hypothetical protein